jgi:hypothetical protein
VNCYPSISEMPTTRNVWDYVIGWLKLTPTDLERFSSRTLSVIYDHIREYSETLVAQDRISQLEAVANHRYSLATRVLLKTIVVSIGALTFGQGFWLLANHMISRSEFVSVTTFIGGIVTSASVDTLTTKALTNWNKRRDLHRQLHQIKQYQQAARASRTELTDWFYQAQSLLLKRVEGHNRVWQIPIATLAACTLSTIELVITHYIVNQTFVSTILPFALKLAIASLPVVITWTIALLQSEYFERPDYARDLIRQYERRIIPSLDYSDQETTEWTHHRLYEDGRLDAFLAFVLGRSPTLMIKNPQMAYGYYDAVYFSQRIRQLEQDCNAKVQGLQDTSQAALMQISEQAALPPLITVDRSDLEIHEQEVRRHFFRNAWIAQETPKLLARLQTEITVTKANYADEIRRQQQKLKQAVNAYQEGYQQWQKLNESLNKLP